MQLCSVADIGRADNLSANLPGGWANSRPEYHTGHTVKYSKKLRLFSFIYLSIFAVGILHLSLLSFDVAHADV